MIIPYYVWFFAVVFILFKEIVYAGKLELSFQESNDCACGKSAEVASRIVGGKETQPHEYPWMVALFYNGGMYCGGSLINDRYVLTAGHCLKWAKKENLTVILGMHDRVLVETQRRGALIVEIESIYIHEKFKSLELYDIEDIGLVKLKHPVTFNEEIRPVCLPTNPDETYSDKIVQVTGWGRVGERSNPSRYLKEAYIKVISNDICKKNPVIGVHILENMICAYQDEADSCQGDSGGPLIFETETEKFELIGVVSWGIGCAKPGVPAVYVRVTSYLPWIASHTKDAIYCKVPA